MKQSGRSNWRSFWSGRLQEVYKWNSSNKSRTKRNTSNPWRLEAESPSHIKQQRGKSLSMRIASIRVVWTLGLASWEIINQPKAVMYRIQLTHLQAQRETMIHLETICSWWQQARAVWCKEYPIAHKCSKELTSVIQKEKWCRLITPLWEVRWLEQLVTTWWAQWNKQGQVHLEIPFLRGWSQA